MAPLRPHPTDEEMSAAEQINDAVVNGNSKEAIFGDLERNKGELEAVERAKVDAYIEGVRSSIGDMLVQDLGDGIGGLYNGSQTIMAKDSLIVSGSIEETIARTEEIARHEDYHRDHDHTAAIAAGSSAEGDAIVRVGGQQLDQETLIEGLTVARTGEEFVSGQYQRYKAELLAAIGAAGISLDDVEKAVDAKDLTLIDDADRGYARVEEDNYALAN